MTGERPPGDAALGGGVPAGEVPADSPTAPDASSPAVADRAAADASLLALVDRLASLLERSELTEIEVEAGGTSLLLRTPAALTPSAPRAPAEGAATDRSAEPSATASGGAATAGPAGGRAAVARNAVLAPLTGVFYGSPSPGSPPFVAAGGEVAVGQVIGLIEAMKLFNEIKSDRAGRVVRVMVENGALVRARQPLLEVEPL